MSEKTTAEARKIWKDFSEKKTSEEETEETENDTEETATAETKEGTAAK